MPPVLHEQPVRTTGVITMDSPCEGPFRKQYAALCYRRSESSPGNIEILLITSRDTGRWVIPKGWPKRGKNSYEVARLEAWEEAGVRGRVHKRPWGHYACLKKMADDELVAAKVQVHLLDVRELASEYPECDQRRSCWFTPESAVSAVREPELQALMMRLARSENSRAPDARTNRGRSQHGLAKADG